MFQSIRVPIRLMLLEMWSALKKAFVSTRFWNYCGLAVSPRLVRRRNSGPLGSFQLSSTWTSFVSFCRRRNRACFAWFIFGSLYNVANLLRPSFISTWSASAREWALRFYQDTWRVIFNLMCTDLNTCVVALSVCEIFKADIWYKIPLKEIGCRLSSGLRNRKVKGSARFVNFITFMSPRFFSPTQQSWMNTRIVSLAIIVFAFFNWKLFSVFLAMFFC